MDLMFSQVQITEIAKFSIFTVFQNYVLVASITNEGHTYSIVRFSNQYFFLHTSLITTKYKLSYAGLK
jgi:hypothetical protein